MHETSYAKMAAFVRDYLDASSDAPLRILDLGARRVGKNDSYRALFDAPQWTYVGVDIEAGDNVDLVLAGCESWPEIPDASCDVVISGQMLEHSENPWVFIREARRALKPGGLACVIAPSAGKEHRYPVDCWRFYRDSMHALAKEGGLNVVEAFTDFGLGLWQDTFGLFQKPAGPEEAAAFPPQQNLDAAFRTFHAALPTRPNEVTYYLHLATELADRGQEEDLELALRTALHVFPDNVPLRVALGKRLLARNEHAAAVEHCLVLLGQGVATAEAAALCGEALALRPADAPLFAHSLTHVPGPLRRLAKLSVDAQHYLLAFHCWEKLLGLEPRNLAARGMRGLCLLGIGRQEEAAEAFSNMRRDQIAQGLVNRTTALQRIIHRLKAQRYLEIGVHMGLNLYQIVAPERHAVDPDFMIPGGIWELPGVFYHTAPSDEFFATAPASLRQHGLDVALVDGDHTWRQALRDIEHCLELLAEGGVVVVHDCLPANAAEAMPTFEQAWAHKEFSFNWTGDVYKAIAHLRATRDDLLVAVLDCDHGVGLVRKGTPEGRLAMSADEVAALDYAALRARTAEILNLKRPEWIETFLRGLRS